MEQTIISIELVDGIDIYEADTIYQYDRGDVLKLTGLALPAGCQVHFGFSANGKSKTAILLNGEVVIPQEFTSTGAPVFAWVYVSGENYGATKKTIKIPVAHRAEITDEQPTPEQESAIDQYITLLQETTAEVEENYTELSGEVVNLKSTIGSAFIISTASGDVACIADGADSIPFKTLTASIDSEQAPVSGWAEVNVTRAGKNLIDGSGIIQGGVNEAGNWATDGKRVVTDYIRVNPGTEYVASIESGKAFVAYRSYDINKQVIESANITTNPYTVPNNAHFVRIIFKNADNSDIVPSNATSAQLEVGHVATTYEPYTAQTISVDLETITGGTVYSGTLTINSDGSGVVVVDGSGEPVSYEFTASQFTSFLGDNSVWCDAGQVTVEYQADTKLYIDTKIAELQALVLENINS